MINFKKTILYALLLLLIVTPLVWFTVIFPFRETYLFFKKAPIFFNQYVTRNYPTDLIIQVKNGNVTINKPLPYCLIVVKKNKAGIIFDNSPSALNSFFSHQDKYKALCQPIGLVGKNFIVYPNKNGGEFKFRKISSKINSIVTKDEIKRTASKFLPKIILFAKRLYVVIPFISIPFILLGILIQNLWYALILKITIKLIKFNKITYKKAYEITLPVFIVLAFSKLIIIQLLLNKFLELNIHVSFPFLTSIIVTTVSVLYSKKFLYIQKGDNQQDNEKLSE